MKDVINPSSFCLSGDDVANWKRLFIVNKFLLVPLHSLFSHSVVCSLFQQWVIGLNPCKLNEHNNSLKVEQREIYYIALGIISLYSSGQDGGDDRDHDQDQQHFHYCDLKLSKINNKIFQLMKWPFRGKSDKNFSDSFISQTHTTAQYLWLHFPQNKVVKFYIQPLLSQYVFPFIGNLVSCVLHSAPQESRTEAGETKEIDSI